MEPYRGEKHIRLKNNQRAALAILNKYVEMVFLWELQGYVCPDSPGMPQSEQSN